MNKEIKELEDLAQKIAAEKNIDTAIDHFVAGAGLVKKILAELDQKEGEVYTVVDGVEQLVKDEK